MSYGPIFKWDAPARASLTRIDDVGAVVFARIAPKAGAAALGPDAAGITPHLIYTPDLAPDGTTGLQIYDPSTMSLGPHVAPRPRIVRKDSFSNKSDPYLIDIGCPFVASFAGQLEIEGGAAAGPAPQDVEVIISRPELVGEILNVVGAQALPFTRIRQLAIGNRPMIPPTISYINVKATPIKIPRGARSIQVGDTVTVDFTLPGAGAAVSVRIDGSGPMPIGYFSMGSFNANGGATIPLVTFYLDIA